MHSGRGGFVSGLLCLAIAARAAALTIDVPAFLSRTVGDPETGTRVAMAGCLLVGVAAIVMLRCWRPDLLRWHSAPAQGAALLAAIGLVGLVAPSVVHQFTGTFRASGRLVWVLCYAAIVAGIALLSHRASRAVAVGLVLVASGLQWFDQHNLRSFNTNLYSQNDDRDAQLGALVELVALHDEVHLVPEYTCATYPDGVAQFIDVIVATSIADVPVDSTYAARRGESPCPSHEEIETAADVLTVSAVPGLLADTDESCRRWQPEITVCSDRWDQLSDPSSSHFGR